MMGQQHQPMSLGKIVKKLTIGYVMQGHQRGYNFTTSTHGYADTVLKTIWRQVMPRGQGWSDYIGARSLKCFELPDGEIALAEITVTDQQDENGRRGIRQAVVEVMPVQTFSHHLKFRILGYPSDTFAFANTAYEILKNVRIKKNAPLILAYDYKNPRFWWGMELLILKLVDNPPRHLRRLPFPISFTTLTLDHLGETTIIGMPATKAAQISDATVITL